MSKLISVIIPSGRADRVFNTVEGLLNQEIDRSEYEIIVVTPEPSKLQGLKAAGVCIMAVERLFPPGKMRNIGADAASGEFLFFIDDDCIPPTDWLEVMQKALKQENNIGVVGCRVIGLDKIFWCRCADYCLFSSYQYYKRNICDLGSAAIGVRRKAFEEVNGFDDELLASEDWDLSLKMKEKNWTCVFDPLVEVQHDHRSNTLPKILVKAFKSGKYSGLIVQKRHIDHLSWLAELSVKTDSPLVYLLLIIPYALAVTIFQCLSFVRNDAKIYYYLPFILIARISYHIGVWRTLMVQRRNKQVAI